MEKSNDGFVRADQIDLKRLDEQLERHLNRTWTVEKNKQQQDSGDSASGEGCDGGRRRQDWEIDPTKLIVKSVLARGTFGTVHRGVYDGQDVAGQSPTCFS